MCTFHKDVQTIKKLNSISQAWLNFRRRPFLCTTLYRNLMQASNFGGTFDQLFLWIFYEIFTEDTSPLFLYHGAKKSKMTKNPNQGGPALRVKSPGHAQYILTASLLHFMARVLSFLASTVKPLLGFTMYLSTEAPQSTAAFFAVGESSEGNYKARSQEYAVPHILVHWKKKKKMTPRTCKGVWNKVVIFQSAKFFH